MRRRKLSHEFGLHTCVCNRNSTRSSECKETVQCSSVMSCSSPHDGRQYIRCQALKHHASNLAFSAGHGILAHDEDVSYSPHGVPVSWCAPSGDEVQYGVRVPNNPVAPGCVEQNYSCIQFLLPIAVAGPKRITIDRSCHPGIIVAAKCGCPVTFVLGPN
jgi:hypothetical protein